MGNDEDIGTYEVDPEIRQRIVDHFRSESGLQKAKNAESILELMTSSPNPLDDNVILSGLRLIQGVGYPIDSSYLHERVIPSQRLEYFTRLKEEIAQKASNVYSS